MDSHVLEIFFPPKIEVFPGRQEIPPKMDGPDGMGLGILLSLHTLILATTKSIPPPPKKTSSPVDMVDIPHWKCIVSFWFKEISISVRSNFDHCREIFLKEHFPMSLSHSSLGLLQKILSCWFRDAGFGCTNQNS